MFFPTSGSSCENETATEKQIRVWSDCEIKDCVCLFISFVCLFSPRHMHLATDECSRGIIRHAYAWVYSFEPTNNSALSLAARCHSSLPLLSFPSSPILPLDPFFLHFFLCLSESSRGTWNSNRLVKYLGKRHMNRWEIPSVAEECQCPLCTWLCSAWVCDYRKETWECNLHQQPFHEALIVLSSAWILHDDSNALTTQSRPSSLPTIQVHSGKWFHPWWYDGAVVGAVSSAKCLFVWGFVDSPSVCVGSLHVRWFPPNIQRHTVMLGWVSVCEPCDRLVTCPECDLLPFCGPLCSVDNQLTTLPVVYSVIQGDSSFIS